MQILGWEKDAFTLPPASLSCIPPPILHMTVQMAASPHTSHSSDFLCFQISTCKSHQAEKRAATTVL